MNIFWTLLHTKCLLFDYAVPFSLAITTAIALLAKRDHLQLQIWLRFLLLFILILPVIYLFWIILSHTLEPATLIEYVDKTQTHQLPEGHEPITGSDNNTQTQEVLRAKKKNLNHLEYDNDHQGDTIVITPNQDEPQEAPQDYRFFKYIKWAGIAVGCGVILYFVYNNMSPPSDPPESIINFRQAGTAQVNLNSVMGMESAPVNYLTAFPPYIKMIERVANPVPPSVCIGSYRKL